MKLNTIKRVGRSDFVNMGPIELRQPIPTQDIEMVDPFILLHHYGPYQIDEDNNPFDLGPHPHRGFEPITFLIQGEQLHRDSLGNESVVKTGDVQWTTAGRGIIHAEGPTKDFVQKGGTLEGIQLWLNLPADKKMIQPNYQHVKNEDFNVIVSKDKKVSIQVIAGSLEGKSGKIATQTSVNAYMIDVEEGGEHQINLQNNHQSLIYLLNGYVTINDEILKKDENQLIEFNQDGDGFSVKGKTKSKLLFLSGMPFNEKVASWGPYVMNNQTEIMEALRDYQMGKMGFLPR
ncbi:pirin family protein [Flavobacteriaceae bacterium S0825]|uniref:pirin family protein n=1 Tax=Gaetbulibacter sp. S0825 TaxID=2720084 RepID=UPI001431E462|nr:pirin family protein [Gaetbulibacter sp. S0825]MCK0109600.1 pirin family protein [Flavobacteriaceae bacterium S0825]NIX65233.1 pirin family protein [Gaetbulibacter sp. S0825]